MVVVPMTEIPPGPRKIRYFSYLLQATVFLFVLGVVLSQFYGFTLLESVMWFFVENPIVLFEVAGFLSLLVLAGIGLTKAQQFAD